MEAVHHGDTGDLPTRADLQKQYNSHGNAAFAIWLGIMLDAIPESFVLGIAVLTLISASVAASVEPSFFDVLPYTLKKYTHKLGRTMIENVLNYGSVHCACYSNLTHSATLPLQPYVCSMHTISHSMRSKMRKFL